jgi:predicted metal-dependent HD superfamily phosphohydrolase
MSTSNECLKEIIRIILEQFCISESAGRKLYEAYTEPWRTYHNVDHIMKMCALLTVISGRQKSLSVKDIDKIALMDSYNDVWLEVVEPSFLDGTFSQNKISYIILLILYHDVWYKVGQQKGVNEQKSADWLMEDFCSGYFSFLPYIKPLLTQGILATNTHTLENVYPIFHLTVGLLLDLDFLGLGQSRVYFEADVEAIWREYEPVTSYEEYDLCRKQWAVGLLARPSLYYTKWFSGLESRARSNLLSLL